MPVLKAIALCCSLLPLAAAVHAGSPPEVQMLVPGFVVEELPVRLSNQNNLRFAPDGTLTSLGYDGRIWRLRDTDGDGLEDSAEPFWNKPTLSVPLGMAWSTHGLFVSSKGKVSLLIDTDGDGAADVEEIIASGWPPTDVGSGGVDATAVTLDAAGNLFFGLLVADYSNAYRLRKRKDLKPDQIEWLKAKGRWREPAGDGSTGDEFSLYDLDSPRGTIQKWDPRTKQRSTIATGIRVPVALAFNRAGDLFNTDQEGETWMLNGNPLDELNHIVPGRNYGFPPRHDRWLPNLTSELPVIAFAPQHQSACGLVFNEPRGPSAARPPGHDPDVPLPAAPAQGLFGPKSWEGAAFVAGQSRGKIWRVALEKTGDGYAGTAQAIARLSMLTVDVAISPRGDLYICCHSGPPDWGTGPKGDGKIFRIKHSDPAAPVPLSASPAGPAEVRVTFDQPLHIDTRQAILNGNARIEFGEYVSAGDRLEVLKPPYAVVRQQDATPRGRLAVRDARLAEGGRTLVLQTDPHPLAVRYALALPGIKGLERTGPGETIYLDYDFTRSSQPLPADLAGVSRETWTQLVDWAPTARASSGTDSRAPQKPDGDWEHGRSLFFSEQLQCAKCHRIRGEGGVAGPDLTNLIHRDAATVLRDIREPGATLHPDYVTYQVVRNDGETFQGFVRSQKEDSLQLFDVEGNESLIPRADILSLRPADLSLMPSGLLDGRKETDVRDLLTFLLWEPPNRPKELAEPLLSRLVTEHDLTDPDPKRPLRFVLVASKQDHGSGQHDYPDWQATWTRLLSSLGGRITAEGAWDWPTPAQLDSATVLVFYFWNHDWSPERLAQLDRFFDRGGGVVLIHSAIIADRDPERLANRFGLSATPGRTGYRHMPFELRLDDTGHAITRGLPSRIPLLDEPYWPLVGDPKTVHVLASALVDSESRPLVWTREIGQGRLFASIPGHYTWTLDDPLFRVLLLRGMVWAAGDEHSQLEEKQ